MIFSLWGGSLADRYPKGSILIGTQAAQMLCAFVLAAGTHLGFANASFIIVIAALNGIAMGFDIPARQAFTVEMTSREDLLNAISLNSSIFHAARVIGPSVAGLMIGTVGIAICFFSKRCELRRCHRRINNDEIAAANPASYSRVSAGTCM